MKKPYVHNALSQYKVLYDRDGRANNVVVNIRLGMVDIIADCTLILSEFLDDKKITETKVLITSKNGFSIGQHSKIASNFIIHKTIKVPTGEKRKSLTFSLDERFSRTSNIEERNQLIDFFTNLVKFDSVREYKVNSLFRN